MSMQEDLNVVEKKLLHEYIDFSGKRVLEIGCGDGRLTWQYAEFAKAVVALDPDEDEIAVAIEDCPVSLKDRVTFMAVEIADYQPPKGYPGFDVAILAWSL